MSADTTSATAPASLREALDNDAADDPAVNACAAGGSCFHCGAQNAGGRVWRDVVAGAQRNFCCAGCLAVAQTIAAAGLGNFYRSRMQAPSRPAPEAADEWAHWDESAAVSGLVRDAGPDRRETSLLLEGLTCGACVWLLESWLARQPGILEVRINYANRRAFVAWNPCHTRLSAVLRAVAAVGYAAHPYDPARSEAIARAERRALLLRMAVALLAMMQVMMFALPGYLSPGGVAPEQMRLLEWAAFVLTLPAIVYSATPFFRTAWRDVSHLRLGMDVPIALGLGAAFAASAWTTFTGVGAVYYDSVTMFIALLLTARYGELVARQNAGAAIERIARQRPAMAERLAAWPMDCATTTVSAAQLVAGETVLVRPGAAVPADGEIVDGQSHVEEALLTGESFPRRRGVGDSVLGGTVNRDGPLIMRVRAAGEATRLASVLRLVERAASERPTVARLADRVARGFIFGLLLLAVATAISWWWIDAARVLPVTVALLVVSCPCALSLAAPAALAAATGTLARAGVLLVKSDALETLARVTHIVLDKTGTLTTGCVTLAGCATTDTSAANATQRRGEALALAATICARSEHPLSRALLVAHAAASGATEETASDIVVADFRQATGEGVEALVAGTRVRVGRPSFVASLSGVMPPALECVHPGPLAALGDEHGWMALFTFADPLRPGAAHLVAELACLGVTPVILSGDHPASVAHVAGSSA